MTMHAAGAQRLHALPRGELRVLEGGGAAAGATPAETRCRQGGQGVGRLMLAQQVGTHREATGGDGLAAQRGQALGDDQGEAHAGVVVRARSSPRRSPVVKPQLSTGARALRSAMAGDETVLGVQDRAAAGG